MLFGTEPDNSSAGSMFEGKDDDTERLKELDHYLIKIATYK